MAAETNAPDPNPKGLALEVLVDTHEPVIYMLNKSEAYVGSLDSNQIVINQKEISRKHLKIFFVDGNCYVNDQGSTNGSYINDTKLVPGKRVEFLPFMSIRLGSKVLLTLISRERPEEVPDMTLREQFMEQSRIKRSHDDKTRIISLKELTEAKTQKIQKKRKEVLSKRMKESKRMREEKAALKHIATIAGMWLVVGITLNFVWMSLPQKARRLFGIREKRELVRHMIDDVEDNGFRIRESKLVSRITLSTYLSTLKCSRPEERELCITTPIFTEGRNGVIVKGPTVLIFLEHKSFIKGVEELINEKFDTTTQKVPHQDLEQLAAIRFIGDELSVIIPGEGPKTDYYLVLYNHYEDKFRIQSVMAIRNSTIKTFMIDYKLKPFEENVANYRPFINVMSTYYQYY